MTRSASTRRTARPDRSKGGSTIPDLPGWPTRTGPQIGTVAALCGRLEIGDVIFIQVRLLPFRKVAEATGSWTNHVGIVVDFANGAPVIAEGRVPFSGTSSWKDFVRRSEGGRVALARLKTPLSDDQRVALLQAARSRYGVPYDTGFNLHSRRQFCSRFVREVVDESTGIKLGRVERFSDVLARNPRADQTFWRLWYLGFIPWQRETVTPASLLQDERLHVYFDGWLE